MDRRLLILAAAFLFLLVALVAFLISVVRSVRKHEDFGPLQELGDWPALPPAPGHMLDTSLEGLNLDVAPNSSSATLLAPLRVDDWQPAAEPAPSARLGEVSLAQRIAAYQPAEMPAPAAEPAPVAAPAPATPPVAAPAPTTPPVAAPAPTTPSVAAPEPAAPMSLAETLAGVPLVIREVQPPRPIPTSPVEGRQSLATAHASGASTASTTAAPAGIEPPPGEPSLDDLAADIAALQGMGGQEPMTAPESAPMPIATVVTMSPAADAVERTVQPVAGFEWLPGETPAVLPEVASALRPALVPPVVAAPVARSEWLPPVVTPVPAVASPAPLALPETTAEPEPPVPDAAPVSAPRVAPAAEPRPAAVIHAPPAPPAPPTPPAPSPQGAAAASAPDRPHRPRARVRAQLELAEEASDAQAHVRRSDLPAQGLRALAPKLVLVAPVEMWFGEARVGVKAGTKTYEQFRKYADVLLDDLKGRDAQAR